MARNKVHGFNIIIVSNWGGMDLPVATIGSIMKTLKEVEELEKLLYSILLFKDKGLNRVYRI
jgi:hypothetical protein